ncbi:hypothetical protein AGR7C_Lc130013 [Agrobacterium deltaense Zutra 3/1]|uniref:Uncharacterized protein n=1 Tax=Agrobacterium deltaense Zutra 3/1 TaxID=1183427 RepID=A0A1S7R6S6_9HYPH|nr:hypothetical protein AGR7C_Lc130013 [Agrobacterium deltaense Zutra 3/1]
MEPSQPCTVFRNRQEKSRVSSSSPQWRAIDIQGKPDDVREATITSSGGGRSRPNNGIGLLRINQNAHQISAVGNLNATGTNSVGDPEQVIKMLLGKMTLIDPGADRCDMAQKPCILLADGMAGETSQNTKTLDFRTVISGRREG